MRASQWRPLWPLLLLLCYSRCQRIEWDAGNFPNPTAGDFKRCNMKTTASICDPDAVLTEQQRYRLNHELHQLESRTRQDHAPDFCQKKGITAAMAVAKHVRGGSEQAVRDMANQMLNKWTLDDQCKKSLVIVVAIEDKRFWVARDPRVPVYAAEFNQIFADQKALFEQGEYAKALGNILQQTWEKALSKQGPTTGRGLGGGDTRGGYGRGGGSGGREGSSEGTGQPGVKVPSLPKIPMWVWLAIICGVIPLLCCCCLCYWCCCRKRGGGPSPRRQQPSDIETGDGMGGGARAGRGGGGGGLNSFLGGLGGAGVGSLAGRLLSGGGGGRGLFGGGGRDRRGAGGGTMDPGYQGGGAYPAAPYHPPPKDDSRGGLYPNAPVVDEGGGGSWGGKS